MKDYNQLHHYVGVIHIHTLDSDGTKSHEEIIDIGHETGLDFILFNDHMTLRSKHKEGWYDDILAIIGYELEDADNNNHYLAYLIDKIVSEKPTLPVEKYVKKVAKQGGFGVLAHPLEQRESRRYPPHPWTNWELDEFDGIELWNHLSNWVEGFTNKGFSLYKRLLQIVHPRTFLTSPSPKLLQRWDHLNMNGKRIVGLGSLDVHGKRYGIFPIRLKIFPYKVQFKTIRSHILTREALSDDFTTAEDQVFHALKNCHLYFPNHRWGDASEFRFFAQNKAHSAIIGDDMHYSPDTEFTVHSPLKREIRLIHNGKLIDSRIATDTTFPNNGKGVYRIEIKYDQYKSWVFSNHIRLL